jgi:phosphatidate cytidylyltransferase
MASSTPNKTVRSNLTIRLITAGVVSPLILLDLYYGPPWSWYLLVLFATVVGGFELFQMTHAGDRAAQAVGTALTVLVSFALWRSAHQPGWLLAVILLLPIAAIVLALLRLGEIRTAAARMAATVLGPLWIGALTTTALMRRDLGPSGADYVVLALMLAWFADTGGYFAGRFFGKHKLYEAVSPKKTWEGLAGALLGALVGTLCAHFGYLPSLPLGDAIGLAIVVGALGQAGDLGESLLKRSVGVKDSGEIVPGHGGILDRLDALFVTSALVYLYTRMR